jgi:hypothetical protein
MSYPFKIEFYGKDISNGKIKSRKVFKYSACITTISKNFQLFEVSDIKRIDKDKVSNVPVVYMVTSYPYTKDEDQKWKDALTFESNAFLTEMGIAIENSLGKADLN